MAHPIAGPEAACLCLAPTLLLVAYVLVDCDVVQVRRDGRGQGVYAWLLLLTTILVGGLALAILVVTGTLP